MGGGGEGVYGVYTQLFYVCSLVAIQGFFCTSILSEENSQKV